MKYIYVVSILSHVVFLKKCKNERKKGGKYASICTFMKLKFLYDHMTKKNHYFQVNNEVNQNKIQIFSINYSK